MTTINLVSLGVTPDGEHYADLRDTSAEDAGHDGPVATIDLDAATWAAIVDGPRTRATVAPLAELCGLGDVGLRADDSGLAPGGPGDEYRLHVVVERT